MMVKRGTVTLSSTLVVLGISAAGLQVPISSYERIVRPVQSFHPV